MGLHSLILRRDALIARLLVAGFVQVAGDGWMLLFLDPFGSPTEMVFIPLGSPRPANEADFEDCLKQAEDVCTLVEGQRMFHFDAKPSLFHVDARPFPAKGPVMHIQSHGWYNQGTIAFDDLGTPIYCPAVPPSEAPGPFPSIPGE